METQVDAHHLDGYRVVRFTWRRVVSEPGEVAGLLGRLLARAS